MFQSRLRVLFCLLSLVGATAFSTSAHAGMAQVVSDAGAPDPWLTSALSGTGVSGVSGTPDAYDVGTQTVAALETLDPTVDVVFWSATRSSNGYAASTIEAITEWVHQGGYLMITGNGGNPDILNLIGATTINVVAPGEATVASFNSPMVRGLIDIAGFGRPAATSPVTVLGGLTPSARVVLGAPDAAVLTERAFGRGVVAFAGIGFPGDTSERPEWSVTSPLEDALYNAAARNFTRNAVDARVNNILVVSDNGADLNIVDALAVDDHTVTTVSGAFEMDGRTAVLEGDLSAYDAVFWSASGSGAGSAHDAATTNALTTFVTQGGLLFVTGKDAVAAPADPNLIALLGCTGSVDTTSPPTDIADEGNFLTHREFDVRERSIVGLTTDRDALTGCGSDVTVLSASSNNAAHAQLTLRRLGLGWVAFLSNGDGVGPVPSWTATDAPNSTANELIRNFASGARRLDFDGDGNVFFDCAPFDGAVHPGADDLCDGINNDCDAATVDGAGEPGFGDACDGPDSDLCTEGVMACTDAVMVCTDETGDAVDICNGLDDDCNPATDDGSAEPTLGDDCDDEHDTDLCLDGEVICAEGVLQCTDDADSIPDLCDGLDNDCNPSTADGADEATLGNVCDGDDDDLCTDGAIACTDAVLACDDDATAILDLCNGVDDDCNPDTDDGSGEPTLGNECDGEDVDLCAEGAIVCTDATLECTDLSGDNEELCDGVDNDCDPDTLDGAHEFTLGQECDGADADFCDEGNLICADGEMTCNDVTSDNLELCGGEDEDCDGTEGDDDSDIATSDAAVTGANVWFADADNDGCGDPAARLQICSDEVPAGYVSNSDDVFDTDGRCCRNGLTTGDEVCDDGNSFINDGCDLDCMVEPGWACDGIARATSNCAQTCGNGTLNAFEDCDDGNLDGDDGCTDTCTVEDGWVCNSAVDGTSVCIPTCGDGVASGGERCDDGNTSSGDGCFDCLPEAGFACTITDFVSTCTESCGDNAEGPGEICDDGNIVAGDGCSPICEVETGWTCAPFNNCFGTCGDGVVVGDEACDDGNTEADDGCDAACGVEANWVCDGVPSTCTLQAFCGDGARDDGEACDDGNDAADDGCDALCDVEPGWVCDDGAPSTCVTDGDDDGLPDTDDNCVDAANADQEDLDEDGEGDACDDDDDNDGVDDADDACPMVAGDGPDGCEEQPEVEPDAGTDTGMDTSGDAGDEGGDVSGGSGGGCASAQGGRGGLWLGLLAFGLLRRRQR